MKKKVILLLIVAMLSSTLLLSGCQQAHKVSSNLSKEADNFNVVRQLTIINAVQGDVLFQMSGKMSVYADTSDNQLEVVIEDENGNYQKHFIGLSDNVSYVVEQKNYKNVSNYKYTLNYNPKMWIPAPVDVKTID